jgi:iron complex outermembrane receptor protein
MKMLQSLKSVLVGGASALALVSPSAAKVFDIPNGDLATALNTYMEQSGVQLIYTNDVRGHKSRGAKGDYSDIAALTQVLRGTGFSPQSVSSSAIGIVLQQPVERLAQAARRAPAAPAAPATGIETVVVTAQHKSENIQQVPIAVTALSQQQLTERQIAGGPDLLRDVPNMNFTKTNFSGYNIELRGIGTQAISVTTDPAVAVAFNDIPFIRNHFFEQEFYDLDDAEVLRGPQGTLYGRNATAGVVNIKSALPTDTYDAMISADFGNYNGRRLEAMLNLPISGDKLDIRFAGEWTKRDGYTEDTTLNTSVDGRDLWSGRMTVGWKPASDVQTYFIWEHFSEDDDRLRSGKQLCETAVAPATVAGTYNGWSYNGSVAAATNAPGNNGVIEPARYMDQGCVGTSLYSPSAFQVPDGATLPYYDPFAQLGAPIQGGDYGSFDPYAETTQSTNLRQIQSAILPIYKAKNDTLEYNANWNINSALTFTSQTGYNHDFLWSTEDYNRFDTAPGAFAYCPPNEGGCNNSFGQLTPDPLAGTNGIPSNAGIFCDPQLGCSDRLVAQDLSEEHAWQLSQEFRVASSFSGPLNFSAGGNFLHYETVEDYYVFINTLTLVSASRNGNSSGFSNNKGQWMPGVSTNSTCLPLGYAYSNPLSSFSTVNNPQNGTCAYIDPNPITSVDGEGHNYFLSQNPYVLNSYALFGEMYYNIAPDLKFTAGARWTEDQKHFLDIPSELLVQGYGYPVTAVVDQKWDAPTGRAVLDWTPDFDFTDQSLIYASYAHGYKAGGANPPGAALLSNRSGDIPFPDHPLTFKPEFIDAFEFGAKNSFLDNSLTVDGDVFYYAYSGYQISEIVDRSAINSNFNASIKGAELEANWEPVPALKFGFTGGYENATANNGDTAIDLMNRTNGMPGWMVIKPFATQASNCILPDYVVAAMLESQATAPFANATFDLSSACGQAYNTHVDPVTGLPYVQNPTQTLNGEGNIAPGYPGFNPASAPNNGEGFSKNVGGNQLPNAPHLTTSFTAEYTMPVSDDWAATLHADFYWQSQSWARIENDDPYDKLRGYSNVNLSLILNSANGWQVMAYVKNVFNVTTITGDFLNSDDSGLTTNVFLTDPQLFGIRVTKHLDQDDGFWGNEWSGYDFFTGLFSDTDNGKPPLWITLGGNFDRLEAGHQLFDPPFLASLPSNYPSQLSPQRAPDLGLDWETKVSFEPDGSDWVFSASARYGRASQNQHVHAQTNLITTCTPEFCLAQAPPAIKSIVEGVGFKIHEPGYQPRYVDSQFGDSESHAILDFMAGRNVGLGSLGLPGTAVLSGGVRYTAFASKSGMTIHALPDDTNRADGPKYRYHRDTGTFGAARSFHGLGPAVDWNASTPLLGDEQNGEIALDWGANGSVLFGRQRASGTHSTVGNYYCTNDQFGADLHRTGCPAKFHHTYVSRYHTGYQRAKSFNRSRMVAVPNLGGFVGLSMKYSNAKVSFGYRADEFFGAMDGGIDAYKSENRGFFGPFANVSIGIGG